jgi:nitrate reductase delta subunit
MNPLSILAEAFRYPGPDRLESLAAGTLALPSSPAKAALTLFLAEVEALSLGEWEELYTRTWDLDPLTPPYIGFHIWGEDYRRGNFLACLHAAYRETGLETDGELPDHLVPVLRCLGTSRLPVELVEVFPRSLEKMSASLRKREAQNPYLGLLEAALAMELVEQTAGA